MKFGRTQAQVRASEAARRNLDEQKFKDWQAGKVVTKFALFPHYCDNTERLVWLERIRLGYTYDGGPHWSRNWHTSWTLIWDEIIKDDHAQ